MPRYLKRWSRWCQQAFFLLVRCCCSLERELSALSYSHSALDVWSWSSLRMSSKHSICFLGCSGDRIIASVTTSTSEVLFLVSRCFLLGTCFMPYQAPPIMCRRIFESVVTED